MGGLFLKFVEPQAYEDLKKSKNLENVFQQNLDGIRPTLDYLKTYFLAFILLGNLTFQFDS